MSKAADACFTGAFVAIFWGTKMVSDSRQEGSLEVQLASPISRSSWLLGKFLGLSFGLILLAILFLIAWQLVYFGWRMGWLKSSELAIFGLLTIAWFILGAMAVCMATMASSAIALFSSVWLFVCGLLSGPIMQALAPDTPESTRRLVEGLAGLWNLQVFNLANYGAGPQSLSQIELLNRLGYGFALIVFFLGTACLVFQKRDIIA